jgi:hypothetical protein
MIKHERLWHRFVSVAAITDQVPYVGQGCGNATSIHIL